MIVTIKGIDYECPAETVWVAMDSNSDWYAYDDEPIEDWEERSWISSNARQQQIFPIELPFSAELYEVVDL